MVLNYSQHDISILISASLSILGCLLIITSSLIFKKLQSYTFRLVTYLAIADLLASISNPQSGFILPGYKDRTWCIAQSLVQNYSQMASLIITGIISYSLYKMIVLNDLSITNKEKYFVSFSFLLPLVLTPLPLITGSYGESGGWCWILYSQPIDRFWMVIEFYGQLVLMLFLNIFFYTKIFKILKRDEAFSQNREMMHKVMNRIKWYPLILLICFGPSLVHRVYYEFHESHSEALNIVSGCMAAIYGFVNALVYGMTSKVRAVYKKAIGKLFTPSNHSLSTNFVSQ